MLVKSKKVNKSIALIMILSVLLSIFPVTIFANNEKVFLDTKGHWAEKEIQTVINEGLFDGVSDTLFNPQGSMTRGMVVVLLERLAIKLDGKKVDVNDVAFTDVDQDAWYASAVNWAVSAGLSEGYGNGKFGPNDLLSREQITVLLVRFLENYLGFNLDKYTSEVSFTDDSQISNWAKYYVYKAVALGLIQGETATTFNPKGNASRAVVAVISGRLLETHGVLEAENQDTIQPKPSPSPTTTPLPSFGGGTGDSITVPKVSITEATIIKNNVSVTEATYLRTGDVLSINVLPSGATYNVKWYLNNVLKAETATYTVSALDLGGSIKAVVTGNNNYEGTVTTGSSGKVIATVSINETDINKSPIIIDSSAVYKDANGQVVNVSVTDSVYFDLKTSAEPIPLVEQTNVKNKLKSIFTSPDFDVADLSLQYYALDAELVLEKSESVVLHPVGKVVMNLPKASLGFNTAEDISKHTFIIGHTNIDGVQENVIGEVVVINGEQFLRIELNGLSRIWIGNVPPLKVSFDTQGGSVIEAKKVKLGTIMPAIQTPTREGYFFLGWNADLTTTTIYRDITFTALWLEGSYIPQERISLLDEQSELVTTYDYNNGTVRLALKESTTLGNNTVYKVSILAPQQATKYVISHDPEAAAIANINHATDINAAVTFDITITNENGAVMVGKQDYFIKWFDANGHALILESATIIVETDDKSAIREKEFTVNRGVGKVEVLLKAKNTSELDYVSYINAYLSGSAISNDYALEVNGVFDHFINNSQSSIEVDFSKYDQFNLVFTPFAGNTYENKAVSTTAYYYDANNTRQTIELNAIVNAEGKLVVGNKMGESIHTYADGKDYLFIYTTITVDGVSQNINLFIHTLNNSTPSRSLVDVNSWSEVLTTFQTKEAVYVSYNGNEDVTLSSKLVLKPSQILYMNNSSLVIAPGGELVVEGSQYEGSHIYVDGNIVVQPGGKITTNSQNNQSTYYYTSVNTRKKITFESDSTLVVPANGLLSLSAEQGILINKNAVVTSYGQLDIGGKLELNGTIDVTGSGADHQDRRGQLYLYDDLVLNGKINVSHNAHFYSTGMITLNENAELNNLKGSMFLSGNLYNNGKIVVTIGGLLFSNVNYSVNNNGTLDLATTEASISLNGTTLVNSGQIIGTGTVYLHETANTGSNYKNGIEYVTVGDSYTTMNYSRYQFTKDPDSVVTVTIYSGKIIGTGTIQNTILQRTYELK